MTFPATPLAVRSAVFVKQAYILWIMFRTKITAKSVSHSNCFSPLLQKKAYNLWTKPFKRNLWCSLLDRYYLVLVSDCRFGVSPVNYPDPDRISNFWYIYDMAVQGQIILLTCVLFINIARASSNFKMKYTKNGKMAKLKKKWKFGFFSVLLLEKPA